MPITKEQAISIMTPRNYEMVSEAGNGSWVSFIKRINGIGIHATVNLERENVTFTGSILKMACTLRCENIAIDNKRFGDFETTLYFYSKVCEQIDQLVEDQGLVQKLFNDAVEGVSAGVTEGVNKKTLEDRVVEFKQKVVSIGKQKGYSPASCKKFFEYWSETNDHGKKMRWEIARSKSGVFSIEKRLVTWMGKESDFNATFKDRDEKKADKLNQQLKQKKESIDPKTLF